MYYCDPVFIFYDMEVTSSQRRLLSLSKYLVHEHHWTENLEVSARMLSCEPDLLMHSSRHLCVIVFKRKDKPHMSSVNSVKYTYATQILEAKIICVVYVLTSFNCAFHSGRS